MTKAILIILTLAGFASGAELEIPDRLSVDGASVFRSSVAVVNASTQTPYSLAVGTSTAYALVVSTTGSVGIGTTQPASKLEVVGGEIKISSSSAACTTDNAGAIRWNGTNFLGCNGTSWRMLDVPLPTISSVSPNNGDLSGGTVITITGSNFVSGATVMIGNNAATGVIFVSASQISATTPAGTSVGAKYVTVTNPDTGYDILSGGFTYKLLPTISSVSPNNGDLSGGTVIAITGSNFVSGATVMISNNAATGVICVSASQITATTPAGASYGDKDVTVTNPDTQSYTLSGAFTYFVRTELDYMEYSSNANAQAAYISNEVYDSYTKCLYHFDGDFTDASGYGMNGTATGSFAANTVQKEFGSASGYSAGDGNYLSTPQSNLFHIPANTDYTVDFWFRWKDSVTRGEFWGDGDGSSQGHNLYYSTSGGDIRYYINSGSALFTYSWSPSANTWYHLAIVRYGTGSNNVKLYLNGTSVASGSGNAAIASQYAMRIGGSQGDSWIPTGYWDEWRFSNGIARWTANFTPPTSAYSPNLQCYSESTIKQQSFYSLKVIALATNSKDKTLTRTISSPVNLSGVPAINFDLRASRTGSNIKIGIHSGTPGTTTEITPNITSADTWQTVTWNITGVSDANKSAVNQIIITIMDAAADNTFYIDNMYAQAQ